MSNSSLVTYTKITSNKTSPRTHAIDTITIHCIVGQWTAKQGCDYFANTSRKASPNYVVGKDGSIGLSVDEKDRSWCSSNAANDHRAVTIEVASDTTSPYAVTDAAYNALIKLVADICKRNNIKKLLWKADKSLIGQVDKQNMTVHRWFANKDCPGEYLYSRYSDIAAKVNAILGVKEDSSSASSSASASASTSDNEKTIWNFLKNKGLNDFAIAGLMGNLYAESGLRPNNLQNTYEKSLGYTDETYTSAVDNGTYTKFASDKAGYGLAQWTYSTRKQNLYDYAKSVSKSIGDLEMQLAFLWKELQGYTAVIKVLNSAKSVLEASNAVLTGFEKPADQSTTVQTKRAGYGQVYYDKYATKTASASTSSSASTSKTTKTFPAVPFSVTVLIDDLNYRSEGSMKGTVKGVTGKGTFTIIEVNSDGWGKLKSEVGWIYLGNEAYCTIGKTVTATATTNTSKSKVPYSVKVTIADLNIRTGAGINYSKTGKVTGKGTFTIIEEATGQIDSKGTKGTWGKLKSVAGWICLSVDGVEKC